MRRKLIATLCLLMLAAPAAAQDPAQGIRLQGPYNTNRPMLAVRPFGGSMDAAVDSIMRIIQRDLTNSNRYNTLQVVPQNLQAGEVDYRAWNALNVVYLVTGEVTATAAGYDIALAAHDVVYGRALNQGRFRVPGAADPDFRMAVHALSDEVVRWTVNQPGSAATRIAFTRQNGGGSYDLLVTDSDGFNLRRIAGFGGQLYSPTWSPDGRRVLYTINGDRGWQLVERDVTSGSQRTISPGGDMVTTPTYAPDGRRVAMGMWRDNGMEVVEYDVQQQCCTRRISAARTRDNASPNYSADGRRIVFMSTRLGRPALYVAGADGANAQLLTPFVPGQRSDYDSPSWSPTSNRVVFHGHWNKTGNWRYQIMIADADRPGGQIDQITNRGENEDPSWAPDGRNIVYTSNGDGAPGLYVIDSETKNRRLLAPGGNLRMAEWSPVLLRAAQLVAQ